MIVSTTYPRTSRICNMDSSCWGGTNAYATIESRSFFKGLAFASRTSACSAADDLGCVLDEELELELELDELEDAARLRVLDIVEKFMR